MGRMVKFRQFPECGSGYFSVNEILDIVEYRVVRHRAFHYVIVVGLPQSTGDNEIQPLLCHIRKRLGSERIIRGVLIAVEIAKATKPLRPTYRLLFKQSTVEPIMEVLVVSGYDDTWFFYYLFTSMIKNHDYFSTSTKTFAILSKGRYQSNTNLTHKRARGNLWKHPGIYVIPTFLSSNIYSHIDSKVTYFEVNKTKHVSPSLRKKQLRRNFQNSFMRPGHALHGRKSAFSNFTIHKVLPQLLLTASISAIHVQSSQSIVLKVPLEEIFFKLFHHRFQKADQGEVRDGNARAKARAKRPKSEQGKNEGGAKALPRRLSASQHVPKQNWRKK